MTAMMMILIFSIVLLSIHESIGFINIEHHSLGRRCYGNNLGSKSPYFGTKGEKNSTKQTSGRLMESEENPESRRTFLTKIATCAPLVSMSYSPENAFAQEATFEAIKTPLMSKELSWPLGKIAFSLLPLAGTSSRRATVEECLVPDTIWTHDQIQGVVNVNVPVRQTVVRLSEKAGGGLLVYNPVAPTPQLINMVRALESKYGPVRHCI